MSEPNSQDPQLGEPSLSDYQRMKKSELIERLSALESLINKRRTETWDDAAAHQEFDDGPSTDSDKRIRAILQTAVEGIITIDDRGTMESINPAAERLFGYEASEVIGKNVSLLMPAPFREEHDDYIANYIRTGHARIIGIGREVLGLRKDGSVFPMELSVSEVRLAKGRLFTGFVRDITERKRAENKLAELARTLTEKNKELETIVYIASHDLRSPLVNIQGFSKELAHACEQVRGLITENPGATIPKNKLEHLVAEEVPEAIAFIQAGVTKMDALLSGFLRFSRLGRVTLSIQEIDMNDLIAAIVRTMDYQFKHASVSLEIGTLPPCFGDALQLNQVFTNLLDNAVKYRSPGRRASIHISGLREAGRSVYSVRDNGIGIAPEYQGKAFEMFHRLNPSHSEGEGLGLAIAQRILERQNGQIGLESFPGKGSTFFVSLPIEKDTKST